MELEPLDEDGGGGGGERVVHDGLVPSVSGSGDEREVYLMVPLESPDNARYTALLSSISDERTLPADNTISYSERGREGEGGGGREREGGREGERGLEGERERERERESVCEVVDDEGGDCCNKILPVEHSLQHNQHILVE